MIKLPYVAILFSLYVAPICESTKCKAQTRRPREVNAFEVTVAGWPMFAVLESNGNLKDGAGNFVSTGVAVPGDIYIFSTGGEGDYENVLICGLTRGGTGVVEHWKRATTSPVGAYQRQNRPISFPSGQQDFIGVAYIKDTGKIYLLDGTSKHILENSWDGAGQIPDNGWIPWATPGMVSELNNAGKYQLAVRARATPPSPRLALVRYGSWTKSSPIFMHYDRQSGFHAEVVAVSDATRDVAIDRLSLCAGNSTLSVHGSPGPIEIVDVSASAVIGTATIPANNAVSVDLSSPLQIGNRYLVRRFGVATNPDLYSVPCPIRYGYSEGLSSGATLGMHYPLSCTIGSSGMSYLSTFKDLLEDEIEPFTGYMAIAFRDQYGQDPVIQVGNNWLLDTIYYIEVTGHVSRPNGHLAGHLQIPNDPALIGAVLLTQFWIQDGETYRLSQIIGAKIEGQEMLPASPGGSPRTSPPSLDQKTRVKNDGDAIVAQILRQRAES